MTERYCQNHYQNGLFRYYLAMRRYEVVSFLFRSYLEQSNSILDIGCGVGEYLKDAIGKNRTVIGVDINRLELYARNFCFTPIQGDAQNLPSKDNTFDLILFSEVLEHLPSPEKALDEIKRILRKSGILIISTPSKKSLYEKRQFLVFVITFFVWFFQKLTDKKTGKNEHISLQLPSEIKRMLKKRKFEILKEYYTGFCFPFSGELLNFLFRFKSVVKLYKKLDERINKSRTLSCLNWSMIFVCENR